MKSLNSSMKYGTGSIHLNTSPYPCTMYVRTYVRSIVLVQCTCDYYLNGDVMYLQTMSQLNLCSKVDPLSLHVCLVVVLCGISIDAMVSSLSCPL